MNIKTPGELHIGCFGAVRLLKCHINQALASIKAADYNNLILHFHINGTRVEGEGENPLKNLRAIFKNSKHKLIEHAWLTHKDFLKVLKHIDILTQTSLSETFNIVSADAVVSHIPVVASSQISWLHNSFSRTPSPNDLVDIYFAINQILYLEHHNYHRLIKQQEEKLKEYNEKSEAIWLNFVFKGKTENF